MANAKFSQMAQNIESAKNNVVNNKGYFSWGVKDESGTPAFEIEIEYSYDMEKLVIKHFGTIIYERTNVIMGLQIHPQVPTLFSTPFVFQTNRALGFGGAYSVSDVSKINGALRYDNIPYRISRVPPSNNLNIPYIPVSTYCEKQNKRATLYLYKCVWDRNTEEVEEDEG